MLPEDVRKVENLIVAVIKENCWLSRLHFLNDEKKGRPLLESWEQAYLHLLQDNLVLSDERQNSGLVPVFLQNGGDCWQYLGRK